MPKTPPLLGDSQGRPEPSLPTEFLEANPASHIDMGEPVGLTTMEKTLASRLGGAARLSRQRLNLTQADVAERIGIASEVYGRLERGHMLPSIQTFRRLCVVLSISADEALG